MADNINPNASKNTASTFLPRIFRTDANKKFLQATLDQLVRPGTVKKINGYIGRKNSKATTATDIFINAADATRQNYQLEPGLVIQDSLNNTTFFKDYIDFINQISVFGGNTANHARLNEQEFYSWDPHISWDKFINFQNYYWMPFGPDTIRIYGHEKNVISTYTVVVEAEGNSNEYVFTPNGLSRNPTLTLFRGQTYTFEINAPGNPFSIKTARTAGDYDRYSPAGLSGIAIEYGTITFTIPHDAPSVLYYQSENDRDLGGVIHVLAISDNSFIDVDAEIVGKKIYQLSDGTKLSNGMKVSFGGKVTPLNYATGEFYIEGVGTAIKLVPTAILELISSYTASQSVLFDSQPFDKQPFSDATAYAGTSDYVVINRSSNDHNPWSRYNRWFHKDTIEISAKFNGNTVSLDQSTRATRAIIEFDANLKLFNFGTDAIVDVDLVDNFTTDILSVIEGSLGYNIDGIPVSDGYKILITADPDRFVKNKIYQVEMIDVKHESVNGVSTSTQIHLRLLHEPIASQVVLVKQGKQNQGEMYWYDGESWHKGQQKTGLNQAPLFDVVDSNGISYGNVDTYIGSSFTGTKLFSYKIGTGNTDSVLGFPLSYKNINNIGDIVFNFNLLTDKFVYNKLAEIIEQTTDVGYLVNTMPSGITFVNGWQTCAAKYVQGAIRIYNGTEQTNHFDIDIFDSMPMSIDIDDIRLYINGSRVAVDHYSIITGVVYYQVVLLVPITNADVLTIKVFAPEPINSRGYYEIPVNLQYNPLNGTLADFTLGEVIDHVDSIIDNIYISDTQLIDNLPYDKTANDVNQVTFVGVFPGVSNLRDLGNITQYGTRFVQHSSPANLSLYHITSKTSNIIRSIEKSCDDYGKFKHNFMVVAESLGIDTNPVAHVDLILQAINKSIPNTFPYYFSDMVAYGAHNTTVLTVVDYRIQAYPLLNIFSMDELSARSVLIYVNDIQILYDRDYTFDTQGFVVITCGLLTGDTIIINEYDNTDGCFIPETPTKLGIWQKFEPLIYLDDSLVTPRLLIQGHDGSLILAYEDYRDDLILELEKRIYNNIKVKYDTSIFDVHAVIPSYNRATAYSLSEYNNVLAPRYYKWAKLVGKDLSRSLSTENYRGYVTPDGRETPGFWRGIYRWMLDTDRPHICPWEMLGFSEMPVWWTSVYGPAPYTTDNLILWTDISNGTIKDPMMPVTRFLKFAKPFLLNHLPVDEHGKLVSPVVSDMANGIPTDINNGDFIFGDVSPLESAWRRSSYYPFSVLITSLLLTPAGTFGVLLDRSRIVRNIAGQLIYKDTGLRVTSNTIKLPSIQSSSTRVQTAGIINYVANYILSDNLKSYNDYQYDLSNITVKLSHRLGAFTSRDKFNLILDSKTPLSAGGVFVPHENYDIILNTSSSIKKITYSGVIITKLQDGFSVSGYSISHPYFSYYPWQKAGVLINIGGISESYIQWTANQVYAAGKIVKYSSEYYRVLSLHTTTGIFNAANYQLLASLPVIGGRSAMIRQLWDRTAPIVVPYNTKFNYVQDVVDFLLGYGEYLTDQGFVFDEFNSNMQQVTNWETSAKEFLFWSTQNWTYGQDKWSDWLPGQLIVAGSIVRYDGTYYTAVRTKQTGSIFVTNDFNKLGALSNVGSSVISLSPAANKLTFNTALSVVTDITDDFNGYEIFKVDGQPIAYNLINSYREDNAVSYASPENGIFGASFYLVQKEQIVIIDNRTLFNDTIYNPESGYKQDRIKVAGYISTNWNGSFDVPGFVFDQAIIKNWEMWTNYAIGDVVKYKEFYYAAIGLILGTEHFNPIDWTKISKKPTAQLLPNWNYKASQFEDFYSLDSDNIDTNQQKMAQHLIGYQKRQYLENIIQDDVSEFKFYQGMILEKGTQNVLNKLFDVLSVDGEDSLTFHEEWAVRVGQYGANAAFENIEFILDESLFNSNPQGFELLSTGSNSHDFIIRQVQSDIYVTPIGYDNNPWPILKNDTTYLRSAGYVRLDEVTLNLKSLADILAVDITKLETGDYIWCSFDIAGWNVYRYTDSNIVVNDAMAVGDYIHVTTSRLVTLPIGSYISIRHVAGFAGFYKIEDVILNVIVIYAADASVTSPLVDQSSIMIHSFVSQRVASMDDIDGMLPPILKTDELVWSDNGIDGNWASWIHNPVYSKTQISNLHPINLELYGKAIQISNRGNILAISTGTGEVEIYDRANLMNPWVHRQLISVPIIGHNQYDYDLNNTQDVATVMAISADNRWLVTGSPKSGYATINNNGYLNVVGANYTASSMVNHGAVSLYEKDSNNTYTLVNTILSKVPRTDEYFGESLVFSGDALYISAGSATGSVYKLIYSTIIHVTTNYNPVGSVGNVLHLSSVAGIAIGMTVTGNGLITDKIVIKVTDSITGQLTNSSITGNILTVGTLTTGAVVVGQTISGIGILDDTIITNHISGTGAGSKWLVSRNNYEVRGIAISCTYQVQTVTLNEAPESQPSGMIQFSTNEWKYDDSSNQKNNVGHSIKLASSIVNDVLAIASVDNDNIGKVKVYITDNLQQTIVGNSKFGQGISISEFGDYIAISDISATGSMVEQGGVDIYKRIITNSVISYDKYQSLTVKYPEIDGYFGSKVLFGDDYKTIYILSSLADITLPWYPTDGTTFDNDTTGFSLLKNLDSGRIDVYNRYNLKWVYSESLDTANYAADGYGNSMAVGATSLVVGAPYAQDSAVKAGNVYVYNKRTDAYSWEINHYGIAKPDVSKIKQAFLYNKVTNKLITQLDVLDPLHGVIPSIANDEIKYKVFYDPAVYSIGESATHTIDDGSAWKGHYVGYLWWDLRTAKFVNGNDDDIVYRNSAWHTLATGATIDIYEWVESTLLPDEWDLDADTDAGLANGVSGTTLYGNAAYSSATHYDIISNTSKNTYYYWVKNTKIIPLSLTRKISAQDVASLIGNPRGAGYQYMALTGTNSFSLVNVSSLLAHRDVVLSVEYWLVDNTTQNIHTQWQLLSTDLATVIPAKIEDKLIDSLCGKDSYDRVIPDDSLPVKLKYGIESRPRQGMFINRFEALKQYVEQANLVLHDNLISDTRDLSKLESYDIEPHLIRGLYDSVVDTDLELRFAEISSFTRPVISPIIQDGRIVGIEIITAGRGYINAPFIEVAGTGTGAIIRAVINIAGQLIGAVIINSGVGYTEYTSLLIRDYTVLVHNDSSTGGWTIYSYDPITYVWSLLLGRTYDTSKYWQYIDWYAAGYNQFSAIIHSVSTYAELDTIVVNIGELVKVSTTNTGTWVLLKKYSMVSSIDWTHSYAIVGSERGTIQLKSSLYEFAHTGIGYDNLLYDGGIFDNSASAELRIILTTLRDEIFIDNLKSTNLDLFFTCIRYILSEQLYVDWIFKTSFIKANHNVGTLHKPVTYRNDNLANFEDYVAEVKPYRTTIREYVSSYNAIEMTETSITDFDLPPFYEKNSLTLVDTKVMNGEIMVDDTIINTYPWKHWLDNVGFIVTSLTIVDGGSGYVTAPIVNIVQNSGSGATARAFITNGIVNRVILLTPGSGYLSAPNVYITGGLSTTGIAARVIATIGDSAIRTSIIKLKFDRISRAYSIIQLQEIETLSGTGSRLQFSLIWGPDVQIGTSSVTINGITALRDNYKLRVVKSSTNGYVSGTITFNVAPIAGSTISVTYLKDWSLLNSADRIQYYYNPGIGELGRDLSQLMTGVDYGGVIVSGLGFELTQGWGSTPFYSDKWDTSDPTFDDYIVSVAADTRTFTLPYIPLPDVMVNVYHNGIRLDDPHFGTVGQLNNLAVMSTWVGNGETSTITIPTIVQVSMGDQFILRKATSDGAVPPAEADYDTALSGGDLTYNTATGIAAEDMIIDGDGFVTPMTSPAPEEVVPGQIVDALAIKVYDRPFGGSAAINVDNYVANGVQHIFAISTRLDNPGVVIVKTTTGLTNLILTLDVDYSIDHRHNLVSFFNAPQHGVLVTIFGIGVNGTSILDADYVIADGQATDFITKAPWLATVSTLVYVNGAVAVAKMVNISDNLIIRFENPPVIGDMISYLITSELSNSFAVTTVERVAVDGRFATMPYELAFSFGNLPRNESAMIVRVNQTILLSPNNSYYTIKNNKLSYQLDTTKSKPYSVGITAISVTVDNILLTIGIDYSVNLSGIVIKLTKVAYSAHVGKLLTISVSEEHSYVYIPPSVGQSAKILFSDSYDNTNIVEIFGSSNKEVIDIQRTTITVDMPMTLIPDTTDYYYYKEMTGGILRLERAVISDNYVWVVKNGTLLVPSVDYKLNSDKSSITLINDAIVSDKFTLMTYGSNIVRPGIAYMQFKDMLNRIHFKRLNIHKQTRLLADLHWNDLSLVVADASNFDLPNPAINQPGIIEIRGERIEYFALSGNTLSKLRRGTLGTGTPAVHNTGSYVQDIGTSETIPYSETIITEQVVSDGTLQVPLTKVTPMRSIIENGYVATNVSDWNYSDGFQSSIPTTYVQADDIEVFVGGYENEVEWVPNVNYLVGAIVIVGSYAYRCVNAHISGTTFGISVGDWVFFIGNIRLKNRPYRVHNINVHPVSPFGDLQFDADFAVDGITSSLYLTNRLTPGTIVTVIKRTGEEWGNANIQQDERNMMTFLKSVPGIWYTEMKQIPLM